MNGPIFSVHDSLPDTYLAFRITVPKFDSAPLSLSGVTVDLASSPSMAPVPTTRRVFRRQEQVRVVLQIYQGTDRTEAIVPVSMRVQILDAKGGAVRDQSLPFTEQTFTNRRADCVITLRWRSCRLESTC